MLYISNFVVLAWILIDILISTLSEIFKRLFNKYKYLVFLYPYNLIVLYSYLLYGFLFSPNLFRIKFVDKYNENIIDENDETIKDFIFIFYLWILFIY